MDGEKAERTTALTVEQIALVSVDDVRVEGDEREVDEDESSGYAM